MSAKDPLLQSELDALGKKPFIALPLVLGGALLFGGLVFAITSTQKQTAKNGDPIPSWIKPPPPVKMVQVQVSSLPEGANVYLNDSLVSLTKTPGVVTVIPGPQTFRIELPGLTSKRVAIDTSKENKIDVSWSAIAVDLNSTPEKGVALFLDGKPLGYAPYRLYFPKDGKEHEIKAQLSPYPEQVYRFNTNQYESHRFNFLEPSSSTSTSSPTTLP
jgi:hypothetical protein